MGRLGRPSNDTEANKTFAQHGGTGTDWGWGQGDGICAMADGVVSDISWSSTYGMTITVDHGRLIDGKYTQTRYRHIDRGGVLVEVGETVHRGAENIAVMGSSGTYAQGKHLHSELLLDGKNADEQIYQKEKDMKANARQIKPGAPAKRREEPTTVGDGGAEQNFDPAENFPGGTVVEWDGFVRSTMEGGQPGGDNIWLLKDGLYTAWITTVPVPGDGALAGIKDLGSYPAPKPPVTPPVVTPPAGLTKADVAAMLAESEARVIAAVKKAAAPSAADIAKAVVAAIGGLFK